jgi:hypothetical protein
MSINKYAYYKKSNGYIENIISIDDTHINILEWPEGYDIVAMPTETIVGTWSLMGIGWSYINGGFVEPEKPAFPEKPPAPPIPS